MLPAPGAIQIPRAAASNRIGRPTAATNRSQAPDGQSSNTSHDSHSAGRGDRRGAVACGPRLNRPPCRLLGSGPPGDLLSCGIAVCGGASGLKASIRYSGGLADAVWARMNDPSEIIVPTTWRTVADDASVGEGWTAVRADIFY